MKIINKSYYRTDQLQKVFKWCLKRSGMYGKNLKVEVTQRANPSGHVYGYAYYGKGDYSRNFIHINIPHNHEMPEARVASTFMHELAHTRGIRHSDMKEPEITFGDIGLDFMEKKEQRRKPDIKQIRYEKAIEKVKQYQTQLKRTQTILKKWKRKVKYYENYNNHDHVKDPQQP